MPGSTVPTGSAEPKRGMRSPALLLGLVLLFGCLVRFGSGLSKEPSFVDEWAYVSQSWYGPLWWGGKWDDPAWLDYAAVDLPPIPKYLIAASLRLEGRPLPPRMATRAWYADTSARFGDAEYLAVARRPSVLLGTLGVLSVYGIGMLMAGWRAGLLGAVLLLANPLYTLHARRAMSDVSTEAFVLSSVVVGMYGWRGLVRGSRPWRSGLLVAGPAGLLAGLAIGTKLSGGLAVLVLSGLTLLGLLLPRIGSGRKLGMGLSWVGATATAFLTLMVVNPVLVTNPPRAGAGVRDDQRLLERGPIGRARVLMRFRMEVSRSGQVLFPDDALESLGEKLPVVLVQGLGRFGPLGPARSDSTRRFDWAQDWGGVVWGPLVGLGWLGVFSLGYRQWKRGGVPMGWGLAVQAAVTLAVVTVFLPLAWDRYLLSVQPVAGLLVAVGLVSEVEAIWNRSSGREEREPAPAPLSVRSGRPSSS